jgi:hypothetical protein
LLCQRHSLRDCIQAAGQPLNRLFHDSIAVSQWEDRAGIVWTGGQSRAIEGSIAALPEDIRHGSVGAAARERFEPMNDLSRVSTPAGVTLNKVPFQPTPGNVPPNKVVP